jgi:hypothetical protein
LGERIVHEQRIRDRKKWLTWTAFFLGSIFIIGVCLYVASALVVAAPGKRAGEVIDEMAHPKASDVIQDLMHSGVCKQRTDNAVWAGTEYGKLLEKDQVGSCLTYKGDSPKSAVCDSTIYVTVDPEAAKFSPKRALIYEDSMSAALLYGAHWQLEIVPVFGTQDAIKVTLANCKEKTTSIHRWFGGQITHFGEFK